MAKEEEAESNSGMQTYYNITFVIFLLLSLYCFNFYTTYESINCLIDNSELDPPPPLNRRELVVEFLL